MPAMENRYKHLDSEERGVIFAEQQRGASARSIGRLLSRSSATSAGSCGAALPSRSSPVSSCRTLISSTHYVYLQSLKSRATPPRIRFGPEGPVE